MKKSQIFEKGRRQRCLRGKDTWIAVSFFIYIINFVTAIRMGPSPLRLQRQLQKWKHNRPGLPSSMCTCASSQHTHTQMYTFSILVNWHPIHPYSECRDHLSVSSSPLVPKHQQFLWALHPKYFSNFFFILLHYYYCPCSNLQHLLLGLLQ